MGVRSRGTLHYCVGAAGGFRDLKGKDEHVSKQGSARSKFARLQRRMLLPIALLFTVGTLLSSCTLPLTLTVTGTGTVTIASNNPATAYNQDGMGNGSVARVCPPGLEECRESSQYLYSFYPATGSTEWVVSPGFPVVNRANQTVGLPPGQYVVQATEYDLDGTRQRFTNAVSIDIFVSHEKDLTIWHQAYGRSEVESTCTDGWQPSWAQWPNDGAGGFVCNRQIYAYYPDEPVR